MATGGRKTQLQCIHQISALIGFGSPASVVLGVLPAGAVLLTSHLSVTVAANSTTNTVAIGTTAGGTQLLAATDLKTVARTDTVAPIAAQGPLAADTPIYLTLASTGAAPTAGSAVVALDYIAQVG
jgi:hypothetical protein